MLLESAEELRGGLEVHLSGPLGGSAVPVVGTVIGGFVGGIFGGLVGGIAGSSLAKKGLDRAVEDDSARMVGAVQGAVERLAHDYLLTEEEIELLVATVRETVTAEWLKRLRNEEAWNREGSCRSRL